MRFGTLDTIELSSFDIRMMSTILYEQGIDPMPGLRRIGLDADFLDRPSPTVSGRQEYNFQKYFTEATRHRRDLWLELGLRDRLPSFGPTGLAFLTAPTLREAFVSVGQSPDSYFSFMRYRRIPSLDGLDGLEQSVLDCPEDLKEFTVHRNIGSALVCFGSLWLGRFPFTRVEVELARPTDMTAWKRLGVDLVFGAPVTRFYWPAELSDIQLANGDRVLHAYYLAQARASARYRGSEDLIERVEALLQGAGSTYSLEGAAQQLAISERTLQRRLGERGLSFRDLVSRARIYRAKEMLKHPGVPIAVIATELGYGLRSSFDQAFKRATGFTPGSYRVASPEERLRADDTPFGETTAN